MRTNVEMQDKEMFNGVMAKSAATLGMTTAQLLFTQAVVSFTAFMAAPAQDIARAAGSQLLSWADAMDAQSAEPKTRRRRTAAETPPVPPVEPNASAEGEQVVRRRRRAIADQTEQQEAALDKPVVRRRRRAPAEQPTS